MTIIIDTRETKPWQFPLEHNCVMRKLDTGDYSVDGFEDKVVIERKGLGDLIKCLTTDLARFRKQLDRLRKIPYRCIMIESNLYTVGRKRYVGYLRPDEVLAIVADLTVEYKVMFQFTDNPQMSARMALAFLTAGTKKARG